jgi:hypothetical protein
MSLPGVSVIDERFVAYLSGDDFSLPGTRQCRMNFIHRKKFSISLERKCMFSNGNI